MEDICLNEFFRDASTTIRVHVASETIQDPYEKNVEFTEITTVPIKAITTDVIFSQIQWKMPGVTTEKSKEVICKKKFRTLIEQSYKITIENEVYYGWKVYGRMQIREEGDFIRFYVYIKQEEE